MRWVKHLTTSSEDPFISSLMDRYGLSGYAIYWLIVERIARGMDRHDSPPEATMKWSQWAAFSRSKRRKLAQVLGTCEESGKIQTTTNGEYLTIRIEKILTYRDEYSRKLLTRSGQTPDPSPDTRRKQSRAEQSKGERPVDESRFTKPYAPPAYTPSAVKVCSVNGCGKQAFYVYGYTPYCDLHKNSVMEGVK